MVGKKAAVLACACGALMMGSGAAQAQHRGAGRGMRPGTFGIFELSPGVTLSSTPRPAASALLGVGAKWSGTPFRGYLIGESGYSYTRREHAAGGAYDQRRDLSLAAGVRLYVAAPARLRLFADVLGGATYARSELSRRNTPLISGERWSPLLTLAAGLQYRLRRELSLGLRAKWLLAEDDLAGLRRARGERAPRPRSLALTVTWHF